MITQKTQYVLKALDSDNYLNYDYLKKQYSFGFDVSSAAKCSKGSIETVLYDYEKYCEESGLTPILLAPHKLTITYSVDDSIVDNTEAHQWKVVGV